MKTPPPPQRSAEVVAQTFMQKIPGRKQGDHRFVAVACTITTNHWAGKAKKDCF